MALTINPYAIEDAACARDPYAGHMQKLRARLAPTNQEHTDNSRYRYRVVRQTTENGHTSIHAEWAALGPTQEYDGAPMRWQKLTEPSARKDALDAVLTAIDNDYANRVKTTEFFNVEPRNGN